MFGPDDEAEPRPDSRTWTAVAVGMLLLAAWLTGHGAVGGGARALPAAAAAARPAGAGPAALPHPAHAPLPPARPVRLDIPSIGLHADLVGRGLRDGAVDPPPYDTPDVAGWYRDGPAPGAPGAALIVGHVDTETRAAVFYLLPTVRTGARIDVTRADHTVARFTAYAVTTVPKARFDPALVYGHGPTGRPELRLITCGGPFDRATRTYSANVVVAAALTGSRPA
ncbi:class F sortase [Streptomyces sp. HPF1205]|uniref:class F sortase n=1 Tax=Streptomyces sp. HPF1205 TaxID=2873262 RepID=UPI001CEDAFC2|nr:class F sortase [Streptomyces sp. HPF1205]